ncbi:peptidylprolyl isomerase [Bacillus sp. HMF5848]|uniref:peptidylprolyl isomerase n=1 Tax=Bacillus sp. HMF5848 TaxID=2495421 RepID=UPI000F7826E6|nr:peptidylprolyl isomerase [Bacillus sp. HMF5848]RSK26319.1 peptidylprolyl isomerase [Bacillus sp. HMF5848]
MKKFLIATTAAITIFSLSACSENNAQDSEVIVETKAGNITKDELYDAMKERFGEGVLRELIYSKVLAEKYEVTDEEVDEKVNELKEQLGASFDMAMEQSGFKSEEQLKKTIRVGLLQEKAAFDGIEVSDEEIQTKYDELVPEIRASHILVDEESVAKDIKQQLENGASFEELAKEYSTDTGSAEKGGDLDFFGPGQMVPEFEEAAYALEVGEVSEPVKSQFGFHVIKLTEKKEIQPLEEMREQLENEIRQSKVSPPDVEAKVLDLVDNADVKILDNELKDTLKKPEEAPAQ